jgi:hypothetical protein
MQYLAGIVSILVRYRELLHDSHSTVAVLASSLVVPVRSVGDLHSRLPSVLRFPCHGDAVEIVNTLPSG